MISLIFQFFIIKLGGKLMHVTELSFKENILCFILASISVTGNLFFKIMIPNHIKFGKKGI